MKFYIELSILFFVVVLNGFLHFLEKWIVYIQDDFVEEYAQKNEAARKIGALKNNPEKFYSTVVIFRAINYSLIAVLLYSAAGILLERIPAGYSFLRHEAVLIPVSLLLAFFFITIPGVLVPRSFSPQTLARKNLFSISKIFLWLSALAGPLRSVTLSLCRSGLFIFGKNRKAVTFIPGSRRAMNLQMGIEDKDEKELITSIYKFNDIDIEDIMVPKPKVRSIQVDTPPETVLKYVVETGFSRYPVYKDSLDDTVGILYNKDLLSLLERKRHFELRDIVRPVHFVLDKAKVSDVLKDMQGHHLNLVMVTNEFGSVVGLATIEDAIEEIVGDVRDENERVEYPVVKRDDGSFVADGSVSLRDLSEDYGLPMEESDDYDTLAGFVISRIDTIPKGGEEIEYNNYRFKIERMDRRRIASVVIRKL